MKDDVKKNGHKSSGGKAGAHNQLVHGQTRVGKGLNHLTRNFDTNQTEENSDYDPHAPENEFPRWHDGIIFKSREELDGYLDEVKDKNV